MTSLLAVAAASLSFAASPHVTVRPPNEIEFTATVQAARFDGWIMPGYHAIVWREGEAARFALLAADVSDLQVLDALERLGASPGHTLPIEAWTKRKDPRSRAPDTRVDGPRIEILLRLPGAPQLVPLSTILKDSTGRGLDMRLAGNRANAAKWESGCVACLYSCPGGKLGNAGSTVRDYVTASTNEKDARFRVRAGALPKDGTRVGIVLRVESPGP